MIANIDPALYSLDTESGQFVMTCAQCDGDTISEWADPPTLADLIVIAAGHDAGCHE